MVEYYIKVMLKDDSSMEEWAFSVINGDNPYWDHIGDDAEQSMWGVWAHNKDESESGIVLAYLALGEEPSDSTIWFPLEKIDSHWLYVLYAVATDPD